MRGLLASTYRRVAVRGPVQFPDDLHVGFGSRVWAPTHLDIGRSVYIGKHSTVEVDGVIGDEVLIANNVGLVGRRDHDILAVGRPIRSAPWVGEDPLRLSLELVVGSDVWIGFGSVVLSGVTIGQSTVVAAGSVVVNDLPENSVCAGNPARPMRERFREEATYSAHWSELRRRGVRDINQLTADGSSRLSGPTRMAGDG